MTTSINQKIRGKVVELKDEYAVDTPEGDGIKRLSVVNLVNMELKRFLGKEVEIKVTIEIEEK